MYYFSKFIILFYWLFLDVIKWVTSINFDSIYYCLTKKGGVEQNTHSEILIHLVKR